MTSPSASDARARRLNSAAASGWSQASSRSGSRSSPPTTPTNASAAWRSSSRAAAASPWARRSSAMLSRLCQSDSGAPAACSRANAATARSTSPICAATCSCRSSDTWSPAWESAAAAASRSPALSSTRAGRNGSAPGRAARLRASAYQRSASAATPARCAASPRVVAISTSSMVTWLRRHHDLHPHHQLDRVVGGLRRGVERALTPHRDDRGLQLLHRARQLGVPGSQPRLGVRARRLELVAEALHAVGRDAGSGATRAVAQGSDHGGRGLEHLREGVVVVAARRTGDAEGPVQSQQGVDRQVEPAVHVGHRGLQDPRRHRRIRGDQRQCREIGHARPGCAALGDPAVAAALQQPAQPDAPAAAPGGRRPREQLGHRPALRRTPTATELQLVLAQPAVVDVGDQRVDHGQVVRRAVAGPAREILGDGEVLPLRVGYAGQPGLPRPPEGDRSPEPGEVPSHELSLGLVPQSGGPWQVTSQRVAFGRRGRGPSRATRATTQERRTSRPR